MNEENGKHEFNFFLDKQLQQKLLEANEELLEKEFTGSLFQNNSGLQSSQLTNKNNGNSGAQQGQKLPKYPDCVHVCGWCPNPSTVYRKAESDAPPRSRGHHLAITRESLFSRDSKSRPQNVDNFVFRHYLDPRKYIEQYRKEHACYDSTNSSATKSEFLESRRFYAYNQYSPLAVGANNNSALHQQNSYVPQPQLEPPVQNNDTNTKSHNQQTPSLQYTNRREQKRNTLNTNLNAKNQHQYKLTKTPPNTNKLDRVNDYTEEYIESLEILKKQRRSGSAKERSAAAVNGVGLQKSATKINVPSANFGGKTLRTSNSGVSSETTLPSHLPSQKSAQNTTGRMLDTLTCVAGNGAGGDKQTQLPSLPNQGTSSKSGTPSSKTRPPSTAASTTTAQSGTGVSDNAPSTTTTIPLITASSATPAVPSPRVAFTSETVTRAISKSNNDDNISNVDHSNHHVQIRLSKPTNNNNHNNHNTRLLNKASNDNNDDTSSSTTSEVSIGQLSTTCLGADAIVKSRPKLEASKTYHVFRNEFSSPSGTTSGSNQLHQHQQPSPMLSVVWNPGKSAVTEKRARPAHALNGFTENMMGTGGPFRSSPRRPATEEGGYRSVEFVTKEFIQDTKPLNLRTTDVFRDVARICASNTNVNAGLKTNTIKPDLPSSFSLQGVSKRPQFETLKKKRRPSKTAVVRRKKDNPSADQNGGRKSWSASTDASNTSASGGSSALRLKPVQTDSTGNSPSGGNSNSNGVSSTLPAPYFKFWNSSLPPKSREGRRRGGGGGGGLSDGIDKMAGDIDMQELAQMVLADQSRNDNTDLADAAKRVLEFKSDTEQGIATGDSGVASPLDGSSKEELLECLRGVNQRPAKPSPRPLHLTYFTGEVITSDDGSGRKNNNGDNGSAGAGASSSNGHPHHPPLYNQQPQPQPRIRHRRHRPGPGKEPKTPSSSSTTTVDNTKQFDYCDTSSKQNGRGIRRETHRNANNACKKEKIIDSGLEDDNISKWSPLDPTDNDDGLSNENNIMSTAAPPVIRTHQPTHQSRKEVVYLSEKEGADLMSSVNDVNLNDDSDYLPTVSDWKQICAEYKYKDTTSLIREAKNKEFKHLIAKRFDRQSSLSHQRRIKQLIEQSRLKSHKSNASSLHFKSDTGDDPVHRFIDIKTSIKASSSGDLRDSGESRRKVKPSKLKMITLNPAHRDFFGCQLENKNFSNSILPTSDDDYIETDPRCRGHNGGHSNNSYNRDAFVEIDIMRKQNVPHNPTRRVHIVPCGIDPVTEFARVGGYADTEERNRHSAANYDDERFFSVDSNNQNSDKVKVKRSNKLLYSQKIQPSAIVLQGCVDQVSQSQHVSKDTPSHSHHNVYYDAGEGDNFDEKTRGVILLKNDHYDNDNNGNREYNDDQYSADFPNSSQGNSTSIMYPAKMAITTNYIDTGVGNSRNNGVSIDSDHRSTQSIPIICGTAIGENNATRSALLKSKSSKTNTELELESAASSNSKSKPSRLLSPLLENNIELLAAKMAVKINTTRLKYTKSRDMERSHSMHL